MTAAAATVLVSGLVLMVIGVARADAEGLGLQPEPPAGGSAETLRPVPSANTFPIPAPHEVSFTDSWHACRDGCARQHKGNDLMAAEGTPIVAVEAGVIAKVDGTDDGNGGLSVWLRGDSGVAYYYAHNSANLVMTGERVARGQVIARVGHTGNARSTPPHIHFQINTCGELSSDEPCTVNPYLPLKSWPQELIDGGADAVGLYRSSDAVFRLRTDGGSSLPALHYGMTGGQDVPLAGDWDGDGRDTVGVYRPAEATFYLRDATGQSLAPLRHGRVGDLPLAGDWDGDGRDTVGVYRPAEGTFYLRDPLGRTLAPIRLDPPAGGGGVLALAGDWNGDRRDTVALFRPAEATFVAIDGTGAALPPLRYGTPGDLPLAGDWDGDGRDTVGAYRSADSTFQLQDLTDGPADSDVPGGPEPPYRIVFGAPAVGARPLAGDWNGRDLVTLDDLHAIFGGNQHDRILVESLPLLNSAMLHSGAVTPARKAAFLATVRNESGFRFDAVEAGRSVYRGRGLIQLTGEGNYRRAGEHLGLDLVGDPALATNPWVSSAVASWYWSVARNINLAVDRLDMAAVNIAVGYRPDPQEDLRRCRDFIRGLAWFSGGTAPEGVNCERTAGSLLIALAMFVPEIADAVSSVPTTLPTASPTSVSGWPQPTSTTAPSGTTQPTSTAPTTTTSTTQPPSTTTTTSTTTPTTTEPPSTTTTTSTTTPTTTEPPSTTTTTTEPPPTPSTTESPSSTP